MAVVSMLLMSGDPAELAQTFEGIAEVAAGWHRSTAVWERSPPRRDDGILVINLWETEEGRHAMAEEPEVLEALQSAGLPMPSFEGYEMVDMRILPEAGRGT